MTMPARTMPTTTEDVDAPKRTYGAQFTDAEMATMQMMLGAPIEGATLIRAFCLRVMRDGEFSAFVREFMRRAAKAAKAK